MGLFERFPYTNFHDLNLTWILNELKTLEHTINEFVAINALKYADPIQWNITTQYEKNTIVIDPQTGTAYISVQPVPVGVALSNTDYWTVVFNLGSFVVRAASNFTNRYEADTTLTATFNSVAGDWLVWGDTLYIANVNITAGDSYVVDGNIRKVTMEEIVGHLTDLMTTNKSSIVAAINEVLLALWDTSGDLTSLVTTDKSNLVNAINEVYSTFANIIGDLNDLNTVDKSSVVNAINEVLSDLSRAVSGINNTIGDLSNLTTTDQSSVVNAINELDADTVTLDNKVLKREYNWFNRHFLFVGDSYGDQPGEWADLLISYLNLSGRASNLCVGGSSFHDANPALNFLTQIQNYTGDKTEITDIIICGGLNDCVDTNPGNYSSVTSGMAAFAAYAAANYPYANISLGFIGNGNDLDPNSQIGIRTYAARQCCRYIYYNNAAAYGWTILHNTEYLLTGSLANIDSSDGVHPSAAGSSALYIGLAQAIRNGSADYNYPIYSANPAALIGTLSGDLSYKIHNDVATISGRSLSIVVNAGTTFNAGASLPVISFSNILFNAQVNFKVRVRLYNLEINGTATTDYYYAEARATLYNDQLIITLLEGDGQSLPSYNFVSAGYLTIEDFDYEYDSMIMA